VFYPYTPLNSGDSSFTFDILSGMRNSQCGIKLHPGDHPLVFTDVTVAAVEQRVSFGCEKLDGTPCSLTIISCMLNSNYIAELSLSHSPSLYALFHYYLQLHLLALDNSAVEAGKRGVTQVLTRQLVLSVQQQLSNCAAARTASGRHKHFSLPGLQGYQ
jgi:hypothetical protein